MRTFFPCKTCHLVLYCKNECQNKHWNFHKGACESAFVDDSWVPGWVIRGNTPRIEQRKDVRRKYLWGNMPAIDILQLNHNEGPSYPKDLSLLFAASGDLRNVVKTIADLPGTYDRNVEDWINDADIDVVSRNILILLIAFSSDNEEAAIDRMLHIWYFAFFKQEKIDLLKKKIRPSIADAVDAMNDQHKLQSKAWTFQSRKLNIHLTRKEWTDLLSYCDVERGLSFHEAQQIRQDRSLADFRNTGRLS